MCDQLAELIRNDGPLLTALVRRQCGFRQTHRPASGAARLRSFQPDIIVNNRSTGSRAITTRRSNVSARCKRTDRPWETCMTLNAPAVGVEAQRSD